MSLMKFLGFLWVIDSIMILDASADFRQVVSRSKLGDYSVTSVKSAIIQSNTRPVIQRGGGAQTIQMVTPACGATSLLSGFTTIPPNQGIPMHYHNCEETVLVVEGSAIVETEAGETTAMAGDVVWQAAGTPHRFVNASNEHALKIYWTYASSKATRTLVENGESAPILTEGHNSQ